MRQTTFHHIKLKHELFLRADKSKERNNNNSNSTIKYIDVSSLVVGCKIEIFLKYRWMMTFFSWYNFPFTNETLSSVEKDCFQLQQIVMRIEKQAAASVLGQQVVISNLPKVSRWIYLMMCILRHSLFSSFILLLLYVHCGRMILSRNTTNLTIFYPLPLLFFFFFFSSLLFTFLLAACLACGFWFWNSSSFYGIFVFFTASFMVCVRWLEMNSMPYSSGSTGKRTILRQFNEITFFLSSTNDQSIVC